MPELVPDDLLTSLFTYAPKPECLPKENFCTQAFVWCLQNSERFRTEVLRLVCGSDAERKDWEICSQKSIKLHDDKQRYLDVLCYSKDPHPLRVVFESKVESRIRDDQLRDYRDWLNRAGEKSVLVALTKRREIVPTDAIALRWAEIYPLALGEAGKNDHVNFVCRCFARFLKEEGMAPMSLQTLPIGGERTLRESHRFWEDIDQLLMAFRNEETPEIKALALKKPREDVDDAFIFKGVYSPSEKYYAGIGMSLFDITPTIFLWVEFTVAGNYSRLKLPPDASEAFQRAGQLRSEAFKRGIHSEPQVFNSARNETYLAFAIPFLGFDGKPDAIREWWQRRTLEVLAILGGNFKP